MSDAVIITLIITAGVVFIFSVALIAGAKNYPGNRKGMDRGD